MAHAFERAISGIVRVMYSISGVAILGMIVITVSDVTLRFFRMPINGAYELVSFLGALAISFAIAQTCVQKGHVASDNQALRITCGMNRRVDSP